MAANPRGRQNGQVLVLFALALVAIVATVGLVIDGGSTYGQRRGQQNAADLAALAGADALINGQDATTAALDVTKVNGYQNGTNGVTVTVTFPAVNQVKVDVGAPHQNSFAGVVGQPTWQVGVTATADEGVPAGAIGAAPITFSVDAFDPVTGLPYSSFGCASPPCSAFDFTKTTGSGSDAPLTSMNMAWTNLGTGNVSSQDIKDVLEGNPINKTLTINEYIGQGNNGVHNTLFDDPSGSPDSVETVLAGQDVVVPIVGPPLAPATKCLDASHTVGCFRGWALFHIVSATKNGSGEDGTVTGYFISGFSRSASSSGLCADGPACKGFHGLYSLRLIN